MNKMDLTVACIVPTYNGCNDFSRLLDSLQGQTQKFCLFVVDSSSTDGTAELASKRVEKFTAISSRDFNHGGTRQMMIEDNPGYDVYIFLTQDAYLADCHAIENITRYFYDERIGAVCGRQLPHTDATLLSAHARTFNYPPVSITKSIGDAPRLGIKTPFMSNSFSAYRGTALSQAGGFPKHVILSEDMYIAAKMLLSGWKVAYAADALCHHSHNYSLREEFQRYFDQGVFHAREPWIRENFGGAGGEGKRYVLSELQYLGFRGIHHWPSSCLRNALKLIGFKLGLNESKLSTGVKRKLSMHRRYWDGPFA